MFKKGEKMSGQNKSDIKIGATAAITLMALK